MDEHVLELIGFTSGEAKVYLSLLRLGTAKTGPLAVDAGVSSSKVYKILDRLEKKGLAGRITKNKVRYYSAADPKRILDHINAKEEDLKKQKELANIALPQLESARSKTIGDPEAFIYSGVKGVTNLFRSAIDELKKGDTYYVMGAGYGTIPSLKYFFTHHHKRRASKGIKLKMLANFDHKKSLVKNTFLNAQVKYLPKYLISNMEIVFYKNKTIIMLLIKQPTAFLIESEEATSGFRSYFETFWKIA